MGLGDWLKALQDGSHWVDEHIFGREEPKTRYVTMNGERVPVAIRPDEVKVDNPVSRSVGPVMDYAESGIERAMSGLNWVYDNGISQPISAYLLAGSSADNSVADLLKASTWAKAWHVADHVSIGQAFWANNEEAAKILKGQSLYAKPATSALPPGFDKLSEDEQQEILKQAGMPIIGNRAVERIKRDVNFFNFASGATDFAARIWLDPTIVGGKLAAAAKLRYVTKARPISGWAQGEIKELMDSSHMAKAQKFLWENKDNPQLINNLAMAQKSAMGPRLGGIVSKLKSEEEVGLFLRAGLGDVEARVALEERNAVAANRLQKDTARKDELDMDLTRVKAQGNERAQQMIQERMDELNAQINADEDLVARYNGALGHYGELDQINLTRYSFSRAERRTKAQNAYKAGAARGYMTPEAIQKGRVYSDFWGTPLTVVRGLGEAHPNGFIRIDDLHKESVDELRGQIARIPGIGPGIRQNLLNRYLKTTTEGERLDILDEVGTLGVKQVAEKHGLSADDALELYKGYRERIGAGQEAIRRYSAGTHQELRGPQGELIHVDEFMGAGGKLVVHPNMVTRLANDHVLIDLDALDKTLARHRDGLKALRAAGGSVRDFLVNSADAFNHLWKFGTLFRLGYIPRVLGDDLMGQVARLGAANMTLRTGYGAKNLATNLVHWKPKSRFEAQEAAFREGVKYADEEIARVKPLADSLRAAVKARGVSHEMDATRARDRLRRARNKLNALGPGVEPPKRAAMEQLIRKHETAARKAERLAANHSPGRKAKLAELDEQLGFLSSSRDDAVRFADEAKLKHGRGYRQKSQLYQEVKAQGLVLPPALGGGKGEYYAKLISSDDSLRTMFASNKKLVHGNLVRSFSRSGKSMSYPQGPKEFVSAWHQAINNQIVQDQLAVQAVKGASVDDMAKWLSSTPAGRAYRRRLGLKHNSNERIAQSVYHDVAEYLPTAELRQAVLEGKADIPFLTEAAGKGLRPYEVHTTQLAENLAGSNHATRSVDRVIDAWFKTVSSLPADRMSRHPLFNQLYEGHAKTLISQEVKQGVKISQKDADRIAETARRLALRDTRKLVFDIAHRSDVAHALRFSSPFFAATTEAWQRWARIIADRPQVVGYAHNFFNAPASLGWMQDSDGNVVQADGTVIDPVTGKKRLVPKSERWIMARVPRFIADGPVGKALGMDSSGNWLISQDSMNLVTQGDPWFNPGTGPIVAVPVNEFVKDKPAQAEVARKLGVLPFGPETSGFFGEQPLGRAIQMSMPSTIKNFLTAFDTSDERYQRIKLQIMQTAAYEHANQGKPMPSAKEIAEMTKDYWLWSAVSAFSQWFATAKPDKYQFFRDQYNNLRRKYTEPGRADEEYLKRFHESHFIFAQATSDSSGIPPTKKAVELSKEFAAEIAANPELAPLIVGPEGKGPFSPEAYAYQLTTPLIPGGAEMQRSKLTAEEAMKENERRLGWAKFSRKMNELTAKLHKQGFSSFSDEGAEGLQDMKKAYISLYSEPLYPDGSRNPYYNEEWSKDFFSFDARKYDRLIPGLTAVANSRLAQNPNRTDLRVLQEYLGGRKALVQELAARGADGGAKTLHAKSNEDLAVAWAQFVDSLVERDTRFGDLHHRLLSRDLGVDVDQELEDMADEEAIA